MKEHLFTGACKACGSMYELTVVPDEKHGYMPFGVWVEVLECPACGYSGLSLSLWEDDEATESDDDE